MKLFTFVTTLALMTANTAAANDGTGALRRPSLVTADLVYVAADDVDVDASSSHQKDDIASQAHIADKVSHHYFLELCRPHMVFFLSCLTHLCLGLHPNSLSPLRLKRRTTYLSTCAEFNLRGVGCPVTISPVT